MKKKIVRTETHHQMKVMMKMMMKKKMKKKMKMMMNTRQQMKGRQKDVMGAQCRRMTVNQLALCLLS